MNEYTNDEGQGVNWAGSLGMAADSGLRNLAEGVMWTLLFYCRGRERSRLVIQMFLHKNEVRRTGRISGEAFLCRRASAFLFCAEGRCRRNPMKKGLYVGMYSL